MRQLVPYFKDAHNVRWPLWKTDNGYDHEQVQLAVLMDIREELQRLNLLLHCQNFRDIPHILRSLNKRMAKKYPLRRTTRKETQR